MKKITVIPFLDSRLKPIIKKENDIELLLFPIYFKVIYDKKNIYFKSRTEIYTTGESFTNYMFNGSFIDNQTDSSVSGGLTIDEEKNSIIDAIRVIDKAGIQVKRTTMLTAIRKMQRQAQECFLETLIFDIEIEYWTDRIDEKYSEFILSFNHKQSFIKSFLKIQEYTGIDLTKFVKEPDLLRFKAIETISEIGFSEMEFSKFYLSDYKKVFRKHLKTSQVQYFDNVILIIDNLINEYCKRIDFEINGLSD